MKNTNNMNTQLKRSSRKRFSSRISQQEEKKDYTYSRIVSYFRFSDWIGKYSIKASALTPRKRDKETFVDIGGTKRYIDTWQPVEDKLSTALSWEDFFLQTGCMKMSHLYEIYESMKEEADGVEESMTPLKRDDGEDGKSLDDNESRNGNIPSHLKEYCYINEWQRLWIYLENDERDDLAEYAPLFRLLIEFVFHPRMQRLMVALTTYNILLTIILLPFFPGTLDEFSIVFLFSQLVLQILTYFAMVIAYRGTVSYSVKQQNVSSIKAEAVKKTDIEENRKVEKELSIVSENRVDILAFSLSTNAKNHFSFIRKELFARLKQEIYLLFCMSSSKSSSEPGTICCGCRESSQMMKWRQYQQKRSEMIRRHQQKRKLSYHELLNISLKFLIRVNGINPNHINFDRWSYRMVLVFIIVVYPLYLFFSAYLAADIATLNQSCEGIFRFDTGFCGFFFVQFVLTGGQLTKFIPQVLFGASIMIALVSLGYGAEIVYRLVDAFLVKFRSLRRIEECNIEDIFNSSLYKESSQLSQGEEMQPISSSSVRSALHPQKDRTEDAPNNEDAVTVLSNRFGDEINQDLSQHPLYSWVKRDAIEHYFFICEVFSASDKIWSSALSFIFFVAAVLITVYVAFITVHGENVTTSILIQVVIYVVVRFLLLFVYPIASLCHANASVTELTAFFSKSSKEDSKLIGGCQEWVEFTTSCPAAWTFMGLLMTWDRLFGLLWTFLAAGLASGVATFFSAF